MPRCLEQVTCRRSKPRITRYCSFLSAVPSSQQLCKNAIRTLPCGLDPLPCHTSRKRRLRQDTCEEVLGKKKTRYKEWISADTIHKLETRRERKTVLNNSRTRAAKAKAREEYTTADKGVKRSIKKDKRDYIDDLVRQAETAAGQGNLRDLWRTRTGTHWQQPTNS